MSFFGVQEIIENCNYLNALNEEKGASTEILDNMLPYDDPKVREIENRLKLKGALSFETVFNESTGFHVFKTYLEETSGVHRALFLKDVEAYYQMRFEPARRKVASLICNRYLAEIAGDEAVSVFDLIKAKNKLKLNGTRPRSNSASAPDSTTANNKDATTQSGAGRVIDLDKEVMQPSHEPEGAFGADDDDHAVVDDDGYEESKDGRESKGTRDSAASVPRVATWNDSRSNPGSQPGSARGRNSTNAKDARTPPMQQQFARSQSARQSLDTDDSADRKEDDDGKARASIKSPRDALDSKEEIDMYFEVGKHNAIGLYGESVHRVQQLASQQQAPRNLFAEVYNEVQETLSRFVFPEFIKSEHYKTYLRTKVLEEAHVGPEDFVTLRLLGRGGFGTVYACKKVDSGKLYAMKAINKKLIKWKKAVNMTMLERHTLSLVHSRFVCALAYAFQDKTHLFLIMDLMTGGDLKFHLTKMRSNGASHGFPEERARFHAAEILLGLEAMHSKSIIFRDLKLENVLLDANGHCHITDLGLVALFGKKKVSHYAGTPGYIAPEVTKKQPYGPAVDLFSFGVTLYRMLSGKKPFRGHSRQDFDKAVCNDEPVYDPAVFSPHATDLLKGLLQKDPKQRLGTGREGTQAIKDHPFFADIDWGLLEIGYLTPPFIPSRNDVNANSLEDIGFEDAADAKQYEKVVLDEKFKKQIQGFDYVSKRAVRQEIVAAIIKAKEEDELRKQGKAPKKKKKKKKGKSDCCVVV